MKLLLFTKYYFCGWCGATFILIFKISPTYRYYQWPKKPVISSTPALWALVALSAINLSI
jgi:hypothetical protein